jgi:hypothetical protein
VLQLLQPADGETARLRIALARIVRPQVDEADVIGRHPDRRVEARPSLCVHLRSRALWISCSGLGSSSAESRSAARERRPWLM